MNESMKIHYPGSQKHYIQGKLFPFIKVGMRQVNLTPTVTKDAEGNKHFKKMIRYWFTIPADLIPIRTTR